MADNLSKIEVRIRELEARRAKGEDVPELDALYAKMDAASRKGADEASKTVTGETPPVKKAKGGTASSRADGCAIRGKTRA